METQIWANLNHHNAAPITGHFNGNVSQCDRACYLSNPPCVRIVVASEGAA